MIILNADYAKQFKEQGFFVIENFFNDVQINDLYEYYQTFKFEQKPELNTNIKFCSKEDNISISNFIKTKFEQPIANYFDDYQLGGGVFILKGSGQESVSSLHQDCNVVDESKYVSLTIWCPFIDVDETNGCLQVLPGSHKWFSVIRSFNIPSYFIDFELVSDKLKALPINKGSVVVFAHNLFHGSKPNYSNNFRPVASFSLISKKAQPIHYILNGEKIQVCLADEDFYFNKAQSLFLGSTNLELKILDEFDLKEGHILKKEAVLKVLNNKPSLLAKLKQFFIITFLKPK
ncbi:MAG: phytanoyl-CoA dioxygenase family protein [Bacteroidia bacterium]|nr:phytanoyl-CoA dioxygenase family protein [Bacteroidia bacterium]